MAKFLRIATHPRHQQGFSLIELIAVVVIIAVLALVLFRVTIDYAEEAEKTAMEQVLTGLRAALHSRVAGLLALEADASIPALAKQNPMDWLSDKPHIYVGAIYGVAPRELAPPRSWYYDTKANELVYRANRTRYLVLPRNGENEIRFKVRIEQGPLSGAQTPELRGISRVELAPVEPYRWSIS